MPASPMHQASCTGCWAAAAQRARARLRAPGRRTASKAPQLKGSASMSATRQSMLAMSCRRSRANSLSSASPVVRSVSMPRFGHTAQHARACPARAGPCAWRAAARACRSPRPSAAGPAGRLAPRPGQAREAAHQGGCVHAHARDRGRRDVGRGHGEAVRRQAERQRGRAAAEHQHARACRAHNPHANPPYSLPGRKVARRACARPAARHVPVHAGGSRAATLLRTSKPLLTPPQSTSSSLQNI